MNLKFILSISIFCAIHFFSNQFYAQNSDSDSINISEKVGKLQISSKSFDWEPSTSVYLELLGKGFYSVNVDFRKTERKAFSIGYQAAEDGHIPSLMYYHFGGARYRLEMGGGLSCVFTREDGLAGMGIHGVIGYRYQKKKGLIFRAGFTPLIGIPFTVTGRFVIVPLVGISLGYSI